MATVIGTTSVDWIAYNSPGRSTVGVASTFVHVVPVTGDVALRDQFSPLKFDRRRER